MSCIEDVPVSLIYNVDDSDKTCLIMCNEMIERDRIRSDESQKDRQVLCQKPTERHT